MPNAKMHRLAAAIAFAALGPLGACAHPARLTVFDYHDRPAGYGWTPHRIAGTASFDYYGVDPANGWTVYVGPDGMYYTFNHPPPIAHGDLSSYWKPHDASRAGDPPAGRPTPK
jgi:hypothetical protein